MPNPDMGLHRASQLLGTTSSFLHLKLSFCQQWIRMCCWMNQVPKFPLQGRALKLCAASNKMQK